jgi:hypothetical protein
MKPFFSLCNGLAVASLFFFLSSCRKVSEVLRKDHFTGLPQPVDTLNILYDRKGNLVRPGVGHDDKINIYRTNKVWQLLLGGDGGGDLGAGPAAGSGG